MFAHRIRPAAIWDRSSLLIERAGAHAARFRRRLVRRLVSARVPGLVVSVEAARIGGWLAPDRPLVCVRQERLPDVCVYVGTRAVGIHLEVLLLVAVEPGWLKRSAAGLLSRGAWWSWSLPGGVAPQEDLRTFLTVVETSVQEVARILAARVAGAGNVLAGERGTVLERWN